MLSLSNPHLHFSIDPDTGRWNLRPHNQETPYVEGARFGASYSMRSQRFQWKGTFVNPQREAVTQRDSVHGPLTALKLCAAHRTGGAELHWELEFALPTERPFLLWRAKVHNEGHQPVALNTIDLAVVGRQFENGARSKASSSALCLHPSPGRLAFFSNGYQSWSFAGALQAEMRQPSSSFGPMGDPRRVNLLTPNVRRRGHFVSDMFSVLGDLDHDLGVVVGFLSQLEQFGHVEAALGSLSLKLTAQCDGVALPPGGERVTDWAYLQFVMLDDSDALAEYAEAVARQTKARIPVNTPIGWCSWYHYFDRVTEKDLTDNLEAIVKARQRLPLDFVQLDDGFQAQVGDWFETNAKFPHGLTWLANHIRAGGQTPGLWLAPYIVRSDARILREHPDWFLRTPNGRLANAGFNWYRWCYGLDPTHPAVREHVRRLMTTAVGEWGFPYLKLDFLYAAALPAKRYDPSLTRAQAMRLALSDMRAAAGDETFILGCGCPLGSAIGMVDGMRISTDVAPDWHPEFFSPRLSGLSRTFIRHEMEFVSVRNAIRNTINRAPLHRRWWVNDPDCLLVRDHETRLNEAQVRSLASMIALSGGMFLLSDDMIKLNAKRHRYIAPLLPVLNASARAVDWMSSAMPDTLTLPLTGATGEWLVVGVFNWEDKPRRRCLELAQLGLAIDQAYIISDFWEGTHDVLPAGQRLTFPKIPAHGVHLIALRRLRPGPMVVASTFHFSQGAEITAWHEQEQGLNLKIDLERLDEGELRLRLPSVPIRVSVEGQVIPAQAVGGESIYSLRFTVDRSAGVEVQW